MRIRNILTSLALLTLGSNLVFAEQGAENICKNLKSCSDWVSSKTNSTYSLGKLEKRTLKIEKDLDLSVGDPDTLFSYLLSQSDFARIKRENGNYDIVALKELKDFTFPIVKIETLKPSFDLYALEFFFSNKSRVKNAMIILKKYISKNGRIVEASDGSRVIVTDSAYQLMTIKNIADELNK